MKINVYAATLIVSQLLFAQHSFAQALFPDLATTTTMSEEAVSAANLMLDRSVKACIAQAEKATGEFEPSTSVTEIRTIDKANGIYDIDLLLVQGGDIVLGFKTVKVTGKWIKGIFGPVLTLSCTVADKE